MKRLNGWQRIWVVLSGLGLLPVLYAAWHGYDSSRIDESVVSQLGDPTCTTFPLVMRDEDVSAKGAALDELTKPRTEQYRVEDPDGRKWLLATAKKFSEAQAVEIAKRAIPQAQKQKDFKAALVIPGWRTLLDPPANFSDRDALLLATKLPKQEPEMAVACDSLLWLWHWHSEPIATLEEYRSWSPKHQLQETLVVGGIAFAFWAASAALLYLTGWIVGWVIRGFRRH